MGHDAMEESPQIPSDLVFYARCLGRGWSVGVGRGAQRMPAQADQEHTAQSVRRPSAPNPKPCAQLRAALARAVLGNVALPVYETPCPLFDPLGNCKGASREGSSVARRMRLTGLGPGHELAGPALPGHDAFRRTFPTV